MTQMSAECQPVAIAMHRPGSLQAVRLWRPETHVAIGRHLRQSLMKYRLLRARQLFWKQRPVLTAEAATNLPPHPAVAQTCHLAALMAAPETHETLTVQYKTEN